MIDTLVSVEVCNIQHARQRAFNTKLVAQKFEGKKKNCPTFNRWVRGEMQLNKVWKA